MENRNMIQDLTRYRVKIERDGKSVVDVPGILCLPGLFAAPRLSVASIIAAPLLGYSVRLENENGKAVDAENVIRKTAETVMETAADTARTIKEEIHKAWEAVSADDPESDETEEAAETESEPAQETESTEDILEDLERHEEKEIPTIQINPDDSADV